MEPVDKSSQIEIYDLKQIIENNGMISEISLEEQFCREKDINTKDVLVLTNDYKVNGKNVTFERVIVFKEMIPF